MWEDAVSYFDTEITSMIKREYRELYPRLCILILGSVGLKIDDEYSDLEAAFYLSYSGWKEYGASLQLSLNQALRDRNPWKKKGSVLCVHPISWLLDGQAEQILKKQNKIQWNQIEIPSLFTMQHNQIYYDPEGKLTSLREQTKPENYPEVQWKRRILSSYRMLLSELDTFGTDIEKAIMSKSLRVKLLAVENAIESFKEYIIAHNLLPEVNMKSDDLDEELLWAERMHAWENTDWHTLLNSYSEEAAEDGYPLDDFWVWSLWGKLVNASKREKECKDGVY